jgi:hypothetical protein
MRPVVRPDRVEQLRPHRRGRWVRGGDRVMVAAHEMQDRGPRCDGVDVRSVERHSHRRVHRRRLRPDPEARVEDGSDAGLTEPVQRDAADDPPAGRPVRYWDANTQWRLLPFVPGSEINVSSAGSVPDKTRVAVPDTAHHTNKSPTLAVDGRVRIMLASTPFAVAVPRDVICAAPSGTTGVRPPAGGVAVVDTVIVIDAGVGSSTAAAVIALTVSVCVPSASTGVVHGDVTVENDPLSTLAWNVPPLMLDTNVTVGVLVVTVAPFAGDVIVVSGVVPPVTTSTEATFDRPLVCPDVFVSVT